jgi:excalibur calcium-binding domain-containing protein
MTAAHAQRERKKKWPWIVAALVLVFVIAGLFGDEDGSPQEVATLPTGLTDLDSATARDRLQEQGFTVTIESVDGRMVIIESNWNVVSASLRDGNDVLLRVAKPTTKPTAVPETSKPALVPTTEAPAVADIPAPVETPPTRAAPEPAPDPAPAPDAYYANCTAARAAGAAPLYAGQPGYRPALDRDKDGVACE